jgi:hypothetical protein
VSYVFDSSALSMMFRNFYRATFPTLWERFDALVEQGKVTSTREVRREIEDSSVESLRNWAKQHPEIFPAPTSEEAKRVSCIYQVRHFQQNIKLQKVLKGGKNADPFVIARAWVLSGSVVTMERESQNAAKIPNISKYFGVKCLTLEQFMAEEGWQF